MLRQRVVSALALAAAVALAVALLPDAWLAAFFHLFVLVAAYEWAKLAGVASRRVWLAYAGAITAAVVALWLLPAAWPAVCAAVAIAWLAALGAVLAYPASRGALRSPAVMLPAGALILVGAWTALASLKASAGGGALVLWLLAMTAVADSAAYFAGRRFGRRKLAPRVSPGKTWEGIAGAGVATGVWCAAGAWWFAADFAAGLAAWLAAGVALFAAAVVGDLFESVLKRARGVKDSGGILPGHGGALDRVDSLLAASPMLAVLAPLLASPA